MVFVIKYQIYLVLSVLVNKQYKTKQIIEINYLEPEKMVCYISGILFYKNIRSLYIEFPL